MVARIAHDLVRPKHLYLGLCVVGTILPYSQFLPFLREHGLDVRLFFEQLFSTRIGAFFGWDVIVSATVLLAFVLIEGRRSEVNHLWAPVVATFGVGVSLGLPLFLYLREVRLEPPRTAPTHSYSGERWGPERLP